ncbi:putative leucine-rich repeat-containing protein DDB_G0290503 [Etheostoma spectabile]|uniref:putative leucine-rich repeat-containing protein DDB_G0290503 n=1 Tax=Etheostoma spectabile TaxID=54343 RepID=UPI0013AF83F3|nr:putative leucine-rich repeat-containing protein DDB_G0290503 [Etheostoma spectabile]XP_032374968.1 putative leucine-rich repeat-containing protein DDB_G0290503 [Etheostoma spectabile]XP_032374969.1 putative leucine-rich repeat-containing protein DDB_G0290503 [Etheostoma spectabile]
MSSRGKNDSCRMCGGALQGNQRRWLFGGQNKKTSQPQTPTESLRGGSLSRSSQSSPWGSSLSLGSSVSLSKSQLSLNSPSKGMDLLPVLTHILGQPVSRGSGQGEFVCGKCVCLLERVFKFDSVIARVRVLSSERLQKLTQERDKIRHWVRQSYHQRHPRDFHSRGSTSEEDGEMVKEGYREMLKENMALSEYECWSEKWDTCPYFIRTGKRCKQGKGCEGCDSLRVSDSDYESVCGVPRRLPFQPFSPLALSRDKSQSMPLHWHRMPSFSSSPSSLAGSTLSLQASSRTESIQSLDSLDGNDPFDSASVQSANFVLKELRNIEAKPVSSPSGSRIPVLDRKYSGKVGEMASPSVNRVLNFGRVENGVEETDEEDGDVLSEMRDEFMPLHQQSTTGQVHHAVRHLRGQLDQAVSHIRTLEAELKHGRSKTTEVNGSEDWAPLLQKEGGSSLLQSLGHSLHSRELLIQECMGLIRRLCVEAGAGTELANKLTENLKETRSVNKAVLQTLRSEVTEKEKSMEKEIEALRKSGRDRERDLNTLNTVLQCNQDIINDLRVALGEKERLLREGEKERELWRQRDRAVAAVLQEKEALIQELESRQKDVQGLAGDREGNSATLCKEVTKLTTSLQEYQDMVQNQKESHVQTVASLMDQLRETRQELREKEKEKKESDRARQNNREDREREERKLRDSLEKRDKLIEQILLDAEERDHLFRELQQNLQNKREHLTGIKHPQ